MKQLHYPLLNIGLSGDPDTHGYNAYDFYWYENPITGKDAGPHAPLYACGDGVVVKIVDGCPDYRVDAYGYGNYIVIKYDSGYNGYSGHYYSLFAHIQNGTFKVSVGDRVKQGQIVANMDNSGHSFGSHLHLEVFKDDWSKTDRVTATEHLYIANWQWLDNDNAKYHDKVNFLYASESPINTVNKDIGIDQAYVPIDNLRVRKAPSLNGEQEGLADVGYYNVSDVVEADGYKWLKVDNYYIASGEGLADYIPAKVKAVNKNESVDQIYVPIDNIRLRAEANTEAEILGWCPIGYHNILDTKQSSDYTWYKIANGVWVAGVEEVEFIESINADKERIAELENKIKELSEFVTAFAIDYIELAKTN